MYTNADITLYNKFFDKKTRLDGYKRTVIKNVFWDESKASNRLQSGLQDADHVKLFISHNAANMDNYIPYKQYEGKEGTFTLQVGDRVVKGIVDLEITRPTDLDKEFDAFTITSVDNKDFGSKRMRHFEVGAG